MPLSIQGFRSDAFPIVPDCHVQVSDRRDALARILNSCLPVFVGLLLSECMIHVSKVAQ